MSGDALTPQEMAGQILSHRLANGHTFEEWYDALPRILRQARQELQENARPLCDTMFSDAFAKEGIKANLGTETFEVAYEALRDASHDYTGPHVHRAFEELAATRLKYNMLRELEDKIQTANILPQLREFRDTPALEGEYAMSASELTQLLHDGMVAITETRKTLPSNLSTESPEEAGKHFGQSVKALTVKVYGSQLEGDKYRREHFGEPAGSHVDRSTTKDHQTHIGKPR